MLHKKNPFTDQISTEAYKAVFPIFVINDKSNCHLIIGLNTGSTHTEETLNALKIPDMNPGRETTKSTEQQINDLRKYMGFNISELAKILQVKRPTIYEWIAGKFPSYKNQDRLDLIYTFCQRWMEKKVGKIGRHMYRNVTKDNKSLMDLFEADDFDRLQINAALDLVASIISKTIKERSEIDKILKSEGFEPISKEEQKARLMRFSRIIS